MPPSTPPHLLSPVEIPGDQQQENRSDFFRNGLPDYLQDSRSTPAQLSDNTMAMMNAQQAFPPFDHDHRHQAATGHNLRSMQSPDQGHLYRNDQVQQLTDVYTPTFFAQNSSTIGYPIQDQSGISYNANSVLSYPSYDSQSRPRLFNSIGLTGLPSDAATSYPPATFFHSPPRMQYTPSIPGISTRGVMQLSGDYDPHNGNHVNGEEQIDYISPYSTQSRASTPYTSGFEDDSSIDKEQPYAQLIYRALLGAPEHTMVLRDIYDWFQKFTDKATQSETKGWQNSIRHNLSMNGAFEKVDSPSEATTKGFMWRLTPAALREGVKSTTRYRSKTPNKRSSNRTQPLPQRQASGSKGGHAARRSANLRRSQRARETTMFRNDPRSEPLTDYHSVYEDADSAYGGAPFFPSHTDSPYSTHSAHSDQPFSPYDAPVENEAFTPMLGMENHLLSPPRSYASTPLTRAPSPPQNTSLAAEPLGQPAPVPAESAFSGSPTPSSSEPVTPVEDRGVCDQDVFMGIDMYEDLLRFTRSA